MHVNRDKIDVKTQNKNFSRFKFHPILKSSRNATTGKCDTTIKKKDINEGNNAKLIIIRCAKIGQ